MDMDEDQDLPELETIERAFQDLHIHSTSPSSVSNAIGILAEASRTSESTRQKLSNPQILRTLTETIESSIQDSLEVVDVALRCIGNACIDNDTARQSITDLGFPWAVRCLHLYKWDGSGDQKTPDLTVKVLYNICSDFEPAQQQCFDEHIHHLLIQLYCSETAIKSENPNIFFELLFWICSHKEPNKGGLPDGELMTLISLPTKYDSGKAPGSSSPKVIEDVSVYAMLMETILSYIRDKDMQRIIVDTKCLSIVWGMLERNEERIMKFDGDEEDEKLLISISASLVSVLSDLAAHPNFNSKYSIIDDWISYKLLPILQGLRDLAASDENHNRFGSAACHIIGNMIHSSGKPETFVKMPRRESIQEALLNCICQSNDSELQHSAAGLLIQLTRISSDVQDQIGAVEKAQEALERLCRHETSGLKQDGIALLKALGRSCPTNQERFHDLASEVTMSLAQNNMVENGAPE